jgi:hypothetical protein
MSDSTYIYLLSMTFILFVESQDVVNAYHGFEYIASAFGARPGACAGLGRCASLGVCLCLVGGCGVHAVIYASCHLEGT